jgi:hypothetical protein
MKISVGMPGRPHGLLAVALEQPPHVQLAELAVLPVNRYWRQALRSLQSPN